MKYHSESVNILKVRVRVMVFNATFNNILVVNVLKIETSNS